MFSIKNDKITTMFLVILLAICLVFAGGEIDKEVAKEEQITIQEIDTTKLEKYEKRVIIDAKWGSGPGEFGLEPLPESYEYMTCFTVAPNGDIYIVDRNNRRINVYDKNGEFLREIKVPREFLTWIGGDTVAIIDGIGVDSKGSIYIGSSTAFCMRSKNWREKGEIILEIDTKGEIVNKYVFEGAYAYPLFFYETAEGAIYLWGAWSLNFSHAAIPLELGKNGGFMITEGYLNSIAFEKIGGIRIDENEIKFAEKSIPFTFNISNDHRIAYYIGGYPKPVFVFQNTEAKTVMEIPIYWRYYPRGHGFLYKEGEVLVDAWPIFDKDLNFYCMEGTSTSLQVIKYTINKEVWK